MTGSQYSSRAGDLVKLIAQNDEITGAGHGVGHWRGGVRAIGCIAEQIGEASADFVPLVLNRISGSGYVESGWGIGQHSLAERTLQQSNCEHIRARFNKLQAAYPYAVSIAQTI